MSYILDALRRADAERQRSQAPALQQVAQWPPGAHVPRRASPWRRIAPWFALALIALGGVWALGLSGLGRSDPPATVDVARATSLPATVASAAVTVAAPPRPVPASLPKSRPMPMPTVQPAPPSSATPTPPPVAAHTVRAAPPPIIARQPASAPASPPAQPAPPPSLAAAPAPAVVVASAPPSSAAARPVAVASLPEPQRSSVTRLSIGGVVHSQDRSQSFVLVGGQIAREGDTLAPGITLERIDARALLLRVAGQAVELPL